MLPLSVLSVLKPPNLSADMALAKEYYGKKRAFLFITSHYILFLGHCQPIKQSFQQVNKNKEVGVRRWGERKETKDKNRKMRTPFYWPNTETFQITVAVTTTHLEKSMHSNGGQPHKEGSWHSTISRLESILPWFLFLCFILSPLSLGPVQNHSNFLNGQVSYCL